MKYVICIVLAASAVFHGMCAWAATSDESATRLDPTHVELTWTDTKPVDVYVSARSDSALTDATLLCKGSRDGRCLATSPSGQRDFFAFRDRTTSAIHWTSERVMPLEAASNFRDLGGYPGKGGKHVRWGEIYRSGALVDLTKRDLDFIRRIQIATEVDLRSTEERALAPSRLLPTNIHYVAVDYPYNSVPDTYQVALTVLRPELVALFHELIVHRGPIVYHCTAGQDRTGIATALLLSALGVQRPIILQDYHLSTIYRRPRYEAPEIDLSQHAQDPVAKALSEVRESQPDLLYSEDGRSLLGELLDYVESHWGSVDAYLSEEVGVSAQDIRKLQSVYLR
jgi:protein-tyrosine phosphatase